MSLDTSLVRTHSGVSSLEPAGWNRLVPADQPFLRHEFLLALEETGCTGARTGWYPSHLTLADERGRLRGAVPLYVKDNSFGEFVFDWSWAAAHERAGHDYYPKIVGAVPFTPVTGPRLLIARDEPNAIAIRQCLVEAASATLRELNGSSIHWLFPDTTDREALATHGYLLRKGVQFHWFNNAYRDFEDFLGALTSKRRKEIRRERRRVAEHGIRVTVYAGDELAGGHWRMVYDYYRATFERKGNFPYLTPAFFEQLFATQGARLRIAIAREGERPVAMALNLVGNRSLYGRYWGCRARYDQLHFETCYYAMIEAAIAEGLEKFEAGAQGEHKVTRGFTPVTTYSAHHLEDPAFSKAVADFVQREGMLVDEYISDIIRHNPYRTNARDEARST